MISRETALLQRPRSWMNRAAVCTMLCFASVSAFAQSADRLERITPAEAGYSQEKLAELANYLRQSGSSALILMHDGKVFFEWGDIRKKHIIHSMRKPMLNALMGIAHDRGQVDLKATLASLASRDGDLKLSAQEGSATLEQVLQSRSGVYLPAAAESDGMSAARPPRGSHAPGTHFYYNNWDFNVAGFIYERATGKSIFKAFNDEIAQPLGMLDYTGKSATVELKSGEDFRVPAVDGYHQYEREKSSFPAYHFRLSAHDLALFGQLYLNRGKWKGKQLISATWIDLSTRWVSDFEPQYGIGYGLLWNVLRQDSNDAGPPSFFHTGLDVHMLGVYPKHKLVMVHRVDTEQPTRFTGAQLAGVIRRMHAARLPAPSSAASPAKN